MAAGGNNFNGWIWPSDRRPGQSWKCNRWSSFKDVLTGKGPDIFVGRLDKEPHRPSRPRWPNWEYVFEDIPLDEQEGINPFAFARRNDQVYDFRYTRYYPWHGGMWSNIQRCPNRYAKAPLAVRHMDGWWQDLRGLHWDPVAGDEICWRRRCDFVRHH